MDLFRSRAIPALIALCGVTPLAATADCSALNTTYRFLSAPRNGEEPEALSEITLGRELGKLRHIDSPEKGPTSLTPSGLIKRAKSTNLATTATLSYSEGGTALRFMDASGATLTEITADRPTHWNCLGERLERSSEHVSGLGDAIRTEHVEEFLERNAAGDLVYRRVVTVTDPPGSKPRKTEARFPQAR